VVAESVMAKGKKPSQSAAASGKAPELPPDDVALFLKAAAGAVPLKAGPARVIVQQKGRLPDPKAEDREVAAELGAIVRGEIRFRLEDTVEFIEGAVDDLDKRTRLRLRRGEFSVQGHVDLHGLRREEAHAEVDRFVQEQHRLGRRCVLIVHGRGLNSKDHEPILKEQIGRWLTRGAAGKLVLAFCSARPCDGGAGAVYVLLRR
jgi:DNA-nicking Smr family endonuclease